MTGATIAKNEVQKQQVVYDFRHPSKFACLAGRMDASGLFTTLIAAKIVSRKDTQQCCNASSLNTEVAMEAKTVNLSIAIAMNEVNHARPINYLDDSVHEARFVAWANTQISELDLSQALQEMEEMPMADHKAAICRFSVLQLWRPVVPG